jgi:dTMP kinase
MVFVIFVCCYSINNNFFVFGEILMKGFNIVVEGPDGAGKSTLINGLLRKLAVTQPCGVISTRHPGSTQVGLELRTLIKHRPDLHIDSYTIQAMMAADLCSFITEILKPNIDAGKIVLSDRSNLVSGMVYGLSSGLNIEHIKVFQDVALALNPEPMHLIVLTGSMDCFRSRRHHDIDEKGKETECRFEKENDRFHERVCNFYKKIAFFNNEDIVDRFIWERLRKFVAQRQTLSVWPIQASVSSDEVLASALCAVERIVCPS